MEQVESRMAVQVERLRGLSKRLAELEIVPGLRLPAPSFEPGWSSEDLGTLRKLARVPSSFEELVGGFGGISAMDTAGGVAFLSVLQIRDHLNQDYGHLLKAVGEVDAFPFAVNGSGSYIILASDDSCVWKFNAHMHPVAKPERIASGLQSFLDGLAEDWEAVLGRGGGPYSTS